MFIRTVLTLLALVFAIPAEGGGGGTYNRVMPVLDSDRDALATAILISPYAVLTASHAVSTAEQLFACGNDVVKGALVRLDLKSDLALFALEKPCEKVDVTKLAAATEPEGGAIVIQGFPGTNTRRTTSGVVANYEVFGGPPVARLYMVMDVLVSGGNSGGPVLNAKGELVGVVQGKICYGKIVPGGMPPTCYGLAIPIATVKAFLEGITL